MWASRKEERFSSLPAALEGSRIAWGDVIFPAVGGMPDDFALQNYKFLLRCATPRGKKIHAESSGEQRPQSLMSVEEAEEPERDFVVFS